MLVLDNGTSYMQKRCTDANALGGMMRNGGMIGEYKRDQAFRSKEKSELRLFVDTTTGLMALYSDETLVQQWNDVEKPFLSGSCIHLRQSSGNGYKVNVSRMFLTTWDGTLPSVDNGVASNPIDNPDPKDDEQRIILRNGDIVLGKVEKIEQSELTLKTRFNEIRLPVSRIKNWPSLPRNTMSDSCKMATCVPGSPMETTSLSAWKASPRTAKSPAPASTSAPPSSTPLPLRASSSISTRLLRKSKISLWVSSSCARAFCSPFSRLWGQRCGNWRVVPLIK